MVDSLVVQEGFVLDNQNIMDYARKAAKASLDADIKYNRMRQGQAGVAEWEKAQALHDKLLPLFKDLFIEPNPVPAKYALAKAGMIASSAVRLPLCRMSDEHCIKLMQTLNALNLI